MTNLREKLRIIGLLNLVLHLVGGLTRDRFRKDKLGKVE